MSKRKDRARAESGLIFRSGHLVNKEEWYKAHPTLEMLAEQQKQVDAAVKQEMLKKNMEETYYCTKCKHTHKFGSQIYKQHKSHVLANIAIIKEV